MTDEIRTQQSAENTMNETEACRADHELDTDRNVERPRLQFNPYLFENLVSNVEAQIEYWNRKAERQAAADSQVAQTLRLKAEGLGYERRLLNAFEPEFRELVECASRATTDGTTQR
jgi:stress response protein YsnF